MYSTMQKKVKIEKFQMHVRTEPYESTEKSKIDEMYSWQSIK